MIGYQQEIKETTTEGRNSGEQHSIFSITRNNKQKYKNNQMQYYTRLKDNNIFTIVKKIAEKSETRFQIYIVMKIFPTVIIINKINLHQATEYYIKTCLNNKHQNENNVIKVSKHDKIMYTKILNSITMKANKQQI